MARGKKGKARKVARRRDNENKIAEGENGKKVPKCFVIRRGQIGSAMKDLVRDMRQVMAPNCAQKLKERKFNKLKDYVAVSGPLGVTHMCMFSTTSTASYMRIGRVPQGPTLTFKVHGFSNVQNVKGSQKRPRNCTTDFLTAPLLVLNGFNGSDTKMQLMSEVIRGMFEPLDVRTFKLNSTRRVVLFHYEPETGHVNMRQYSMVQRAGVSRGVRKLLDLNKLRDMSKNEDIADYVMNGGAVSDSECEDAVPVSDTKKSVKLHLVEIGPRLELQLIKAEEGLCDGAVLYHEYIKKTEEEIVVQEERLQLRQELAARKAADAEAAKEKRRELAERKAENLRKKMKEMDDDEEDVLQAPKSKKKFNPLYRAKGGKAKAGDGDKKGTVEFDDETPFQERRRMSQKGTFGKKGKLGVKERFHKSQKGAKKTRK